MRIRGLQLAGLAVALVGGGAKAALADTTVNGATTTPLATSANGNITVNSGGSITVTAGQAATTADGVNLSITNSGTLASNNADNTTGILLLNNGSGTITNNGTISLLEDYAPTDTDSDGDLDGPFAMGANRFGIRLDGGAYHGDISMPNTGSIKVEGNNSAGISINGLLTGNISSLGAINVTGDNSAAIAITGGLTGGLTGNISTAGSYSVQGAGSTGVLIDAPVTGGVSINGAWMVTGYRSTTRPTDTSHLDADDLLIGGSAVDVRYGISQGLTIAGPGVELDTGEDQTTASIAVRGSAPAVHISAGADADTTLGADSHGFGLDVRGTITASGLFDSVSGTAVRIEGSPTHSVSITGGVAFDGALDAAAQEADAFGMYVGSNANVLSILTRKIFTTEVLANTSPGHTAYGFYFDGTANVPSINNSGSINVQGFGEFANATAIFDNANTLTSITNSGSLIARLVAFDQDPTDDIPPPAPTGVANAIDVHLSTVNVTVNQNADTPFTDDDSTDQDALNRPPVQMIGNVLFGSGSDTFNLNAGTVTGDISFGTGNDAFNVASGTTFTGALTHDDTVGHLTLVSSGAMNLTSGATSVDNATFNSGSVLTLQLADNPADSAVINASGTISFANNSTLRVIAPAGLPQSAPDQVIISAAALNIDPGAHVLDSTTVGGSYIYNFDINQVGNTLTASYVLKTPAQLGFSANQAAAYEPILTAVRADQNAANALSALTTATQFNTAYAELMPSYSSASAELATTAIAQQQSATSNRLSSTRLNNLNEVSAWAQEIGYVIDRTPPDPNGEEFRGNGFGFALGIDGPLNNGALFGISASFITSDAEQPIRPDGKISSSFGQFNAYLGSAWGPIDLDLVGGAGLGRLRERRFIEIGSFRQIAEANWWAYEGHGMIRASAPMTTGGWLTITPQAALTYVALSEQGYDEENAGALDLSADSAVTQRLWGDLGVEFSARLFSHGQTVVAPRISLGYRANLITDGGDRTFHFPGGADFTLTDDDYGSGGPIVGVGIDATNGYSTLSIGYEGEFTDQIDRHSLNVALRYRF